MNRKPKKRTRSQIVDDFKHRLAMQKPRSNIKAWAEKEGHNLRLVYAVTGGNLPCRSGESREIAEKIGLLEIEGEPA